MSRFDQCLPLILAHEGGYVGRCAARRNDVYSRHVKAPSRTAPRRDLFSLGNQVSRAPVSGQREVLSLQPCGLRAGRLREGPVQRALPAPPVRGQHGSPVQAREDGKRVHRVRRADRWQGRVGPMPKALSSSAHGGNQSCDRRPQGRFLPALQRSLPAPRF